MFNWSSGNGSNMSDFNLLNDSGTVSDKFAMQALQEELDSERAEKSQVKKTLEEAERECMSLRQKLAAVGEKLEVATKVE